MNSVVMFAIRIVLSNSLARTYSVMLTLKGTVVLLLNSIFSSKMRYAVREFLLNSTFVFLAYQKFVDIVTLLTKGWQNFSQAFSSTRFDPSMVGRGTSEN